ncbi:MAG: YfhO family protein, partial [Lachnospiraceae bacterium]|nr:YfhO family protein [Lachnospiraceae bacterium]
MRRSLKESLIPAFITFVIFMGVIALKGIYPFGDLRIDYYDMGQTNAPLYYHLWDFLHGKGSLFYSWYIDEGQNLAMGSSIQWNISVFNLFFLFIKRSAILKSLSVFMGIHLFFMAFNMHLFLDHTIEAPKIFKYIFSIAYGLTGYTLTHYTIPTYLDTAALMPLYLITLYEVLRSGGRIIKAGKIKISPVTVYALMTGYMTALGYYMAFMNLIFVLLISGTYILLLSGAEKEDKKERKKEMGRAAARLGIGTFAGIALSAVILVPAAMQMTGSSRFNSNLSGGLLETLHTILWAIGADMYYIKWWLLSGSLAAIVILLSGLIHFRNEKRTTAFFFLFCMYPCALIPFESINLLWHMGTYYHYPVRCGYLIPIVLLTTGLYYAGRYSSEKEDNQNCEGGKDKESGNTGSVYINPKAMLPVSVIATVTGVLLLFYYNGHEVWDVRELFKAWVIFALILAAVYFLIFNVLKKPAYIVPFMIMELCVTGYIGYGQPHFTDKYSSDPEQSGEYVAISQMLMDDLNISESRVERIKNPDTTLNTNYGFIMRRATVGGWANTVPRPQMDTGIALGYGAHFMRILDCGGTLLSDAALHVTETITANPALYT